MRYFLLASILAFSSCSVKEYRKLNPARPPASYPTYAAAYRPVIDKVLYNCSVTGKTPLGKSYRLSGLLFIKQLERELRVVFQNQMGLTYFDFGWDTDQQFHVYQIMPQMNKAPLIRTLRKDFELLFFYGLSGQYTGFYQAPQTSGRPTADYIRFELQKGFAYYIFQQQQLYKIENADKHKKVIRMLLSPTPVGSMPDTLMIDHLKANFKISLQQINTNPTQSADHDATTE